MSTLSTTTTFNSGESEYNWDIQDPGITGGGIIPELYGTAKISMDNSQIIGMFIEGLSAQTQYLNILYAVCVGSLSDYTDININSEPIENYGSVPPLVMSAGTNFQSPVQAFAVMKSEMAVNEELTVYDEYKTATTRTDCTGFGIEISFPDGLYIEFYDADGNLYPSHTNVDLHIQYKLHSDTTWISMTSSNSKPQLVYSEHWSGGYWSTDPGSGAALWIEVGIGDTDPLSHYEGDAYTVDPTVWVKPSYPNDTPGIPTMMWHWLIIDEIYLPDVTSYSDGEVIGIWLCHTYPVKVTFWRTGLPLGVYDVKIALHFRQPELAEYNSLYIVHNDVFYGSLIEVYEDNFCYPNITTLAFSAIPTEQLSGGMPSIDFIATRTNIYVHNPTTGAYDQKLATNPAWVCYDLIHKAKWVETPSAGVWDIVVYGAPADQLDEHWALWSGWAEWCDLDSTDAYPNKKPYTCNIYFNEQTSLQDALNMVSTLGRGYVRQSGLSYKPIYEHPEPSVVQRFLFSNGNIEKDSFSETISVSPDMANLIEVTYQEPDNDYQAETVLISWDGNYDVTTRDVKTASLSLTGCYDRDMAAAYGKYTLNRNRYLTAVSSWSVNVDSIRCEVGDIVEAPSEYGGRLLSGCTTTLLLLDWEVYAESGKTYKVVINHQDDDSREEVTVAAITVSGYKTSLTVSPLTRAPAVDTRFIFGESGQQSRLRRIISITRDDDLRRTITAGEFNSSIFEDAVTIPVSPFNPYKWRTMPPAPSALAAEITWKLNYGSKTWEPYIRLSVTADTSFLSLPVERLHIFMHVEQGDTTGSVLPYAYSYEWSWYWDDTIAYADITAWTVATNTVYVAVSMVNAQGVEGPKSAPLAYYVDTSFTPISTSSNVEVMDNGYDYRSNGTDGYTVYITWIPYGWELVSVNGAEKYAPIMRWNGGSNYYTFKSYLIAYGFVYSSGLYPAADRLLWYETPDIGNIYTNSGELITDADALDTICKQAAVSGMQFKYSDLWVAFTVCPTMKTGGIGVIDLSQDDYGLDWEWIQVTCPGGNGFRVTEVDIQNSEIVYKMNEGSVFLAQINWDYSLTAPFIDGFAVMVRYQKYWWSWPLASAMSSNPITIAEIIAILDLEAGGGIDAANDFATQYNDQWLNDVDIPYFYLMISSDYFYEVLKVDATTLAVSRGQEGTTARSWGAGAMVSYSPCEYIDEITFIQDANKRSMDINQTLTIGWALHSAIVAYKVMADSVKRSNYAYWDLVELK